MPVAEHRVHRRGAGWAFDGKLGDGGLCERHLQAGAGVAPSEHLKDELDVAVCVTAVAALTALGPRESMPGLPHPQGGGREPGPGGQVTDGQCRRGRGGVGCVGGLRFRCHPDTVT